MSLPIRQGATHKVVLGPFVDVGDGFTPEVAVDGGGSDLSTVDDAEAILHDNGTVVDISAYVFVPITTADGYYHLTLQSGISGTVGHMTIIVQDDSLCLPVKADFVVMDTAAYDLLYADAATGVPADMATATALAVVDTNVDDIETAVGVAGAGLTNIGTIATVTTLTNLPTITANWLTAAGTHADFTTEIQAGLATPTNITAGTIATVTNLTNAPTNGDLTATMKTSVTTAATASTPTATAVTGAVGSVTGAVGSVTGHTNQTADHTAAIAAVKAETALIVADTGELQVDDVPTLIANLDAVVDTVKAETVLILADTAVIGAAGAGLTAVPWNASWDAEVESEVNDAIDTVISELGVAAPTATPTLRTGMMLMYMALRNKTIVQTSGTDALEIHNDAGTKIAAKLLTDDSSDFTEAQMA